MEASADEPVGAFVLPAEGEPRLAAVHRPCEREETGLRLFVGEGGPPGLVVKLVQSKPAFPEKEAIIAPRAVHVLDAEVVGVLEDDPAPPGRIGEERRAGDSVDLELEDGPDAIERGPRGEVAPLRAAGVVGLVQQIPGVGGDQHRLRDERGAAETRPRWTGRDGRDRPVEHEQVEQPPQVGESQEDPHRQQVERIQLDGDVVAEIEGDHVAHDADAHERAQQRSAAEGEEQAADHLRGAGEDGISRGGAHERPQESHRRGLPKGLDQLAGEGLGELGRDDLVRAVREHRRGEREPDVDPQPRSQASVLRPFSVEDRPDHRRDPRVDQEAEHLHIVVGGVSAARGPDVDVDPEQVLPGPRHEPVPYVLVRLGEDRPSPGDSLQRERKVVDHQVAEGEAEQSPLGGTPRRGAPRIIHAPEPPSCFPRVGRLHATFCLYATLQHLTLILNWASFRPPLVPQGWEVNVGEVDRRSAARPWRTVYLRFRTRRHRQEQQYRGGGVLRRRWGRGRLGRPGAPTGRSHPVRSWSLARAVRDLRAGEIKAFQQVQYLLAFLVLEIFSWGVDTEIFQFSWNDVKTYSAPIGVGILAVKLLGPYAAYWANGGRQGSV